MVGSLFNQREEDSILEADVVFQQFAKRDELLFEGTWCAGTESADHLSNGFVIFDEFPYHVTRLKNVCGCEWEEGLFFRVEMLREMLVVEGYDMTGLELWIVRPELQKRLFPLLQADCEQKGLMMIAC
jgi:hypothetical protein